MVSSRKVVQFQVNEGSTAAASSEGSYLLRGADTRRPYSKRMFGRRHSNAAWWGLPTQQQASRYLRQNWNKIEQMARDCLAKGSLEEGRTNLVMV
jgi:hypothetical protein